MWIPILSCVLLLAFGLGIAAVLIRQEQQEIERLRAERIEVERGRRW